ncbi:caspase-2-like isoform X2 [Haemaphysalis longicornis]
MGNSLAQEIDYEDRRKFEDPKFVNGLAENIDFDRLATSLRDSGAVTEAMIDDIRKPTKLEERNRRLLQQVSERGRHIDVLQNCGMLGALSLLEGQTPLHQRLPTETKPGQVWASRPGGEPVFSNPRQSNGDVTMGKASKVEVEVIPATELKRGPNEMMEVLSKAAQEEQQKVADCLVVVLMSHGGTVTMRGSDNGPLPQQCIYGSDDEAIPLKSIYEVFDNKNCPSLLGKPKLFFIQGCRGRKLDAGTAKHGPRDVMDAYPLPSNTESVPGTRDGRLRMPFWSDMYSCYVSDDNYKAHKNTATGSRFLSAMCSVFSQRAYDMHLSDLMLHVQLKVMESVSHKGNHQTPCITCIGWRKHLYFNPGLPVDPIPQPTPCTE